MFPLYLPQTIFDGRERDKTVSMRERGRERERVHDIVSELECVCQRDNERVCKRDRLRVYVKKRECVCERERERRGRA